MKKNLVFLTLAAIALASCNGGFKKGDNGLLYNIHTDKGGPKAKVGDFVTVNLAVKTDGDSVLYNSYDNGQPLNMLVRKGQYKGDVLDGLQMLAEGDSATFKVVADSAFKKGPRPPGFKGKYLVYVIKMEKLIPKGTQTDQAFQATINDYIKKRADAFKAQEPARIKKYVDDNKLTLTTSPTGLQYIITQKGSGPAPMPGDTLYVNYVGKKLDGKVFDTNIKAEAIKNKLPINPMNPYKPFPVLVNDPRIIKGWNEGLLLLTAGGKASLLIPSSLGYGEQGNGPIGPYSPLSFDIELVKIVHPDPNAPKPAAPVMPTMPQATKK